MRKKRSVTLLMICGETDFKSSDINHLKEIGQLIHSGGRPFVFDGGRVGTSQRSDEAEHHECRKKTYRPAARSWQGRSARKGARFGAPAAVRSFRSDALEATFGAEFRVLVQAYPVIKFEREDGFWIAIRVKPLGPDGPQAHLVIAVPSDRTLRLRGWAFETVGTRPRPFAPKHTNFPDASICAFDPASGVWTPENGLLELVDHYVIWMIKSWHRTVFGWWPGAQVGTLPFYRLMEFDRREYCGCGSGILYDLCHRNADAAVPEIQARAQFERAFGCSYSARKTPPALIAAAKSIWRILPSATYDFGRDLGQLS